MGCSWVREGTVFVRSTGLGLRASYDQARHVVSRSRFALIRFPSGTIRSDPLPRSGLIKPKAKRQTFVQETEHRRAQPRAWPQN